jgi:hypothetical protein
MLPATRIVASLLQLAAATNSPASQFDAGDFLAFHQPPRKFGRSLNSFATMRLKLISVTTASRFCYDRPRIKNIAPQYVHLDHAIKVVLWMAAADLSAATNSIPLSVVVIGEHPMTAMLLTMKCPFKHAQPTPLRKSVNNARLRIYLTQHE